MTRLKYERRSRRQSQKHLAKATGLTQPALSQIERSILIPTPLQLQRLADAYGIAPSELLKDVVVITEARADVR